MDKYIYDIWLSQAAKAPSYIQQLIDIYGTAEEVYKDKGKKGYFGRNDKYIKDNFEKLSLEYAESIIKKCRDNNIEIIGVDDGYFSDYLINSPVCPRILYAKGNKELLKKPLVTVTGTRKANYEGKENARKFSQILSAAGLGVVTGFADGIEETVIHSVKEVISVLPCGLLNPYPKSHYKLLEKIYSTGGLAISVFEPGCDAYRWNFELRNKILAAISESTLIVQAGENSATSMTFRNCADYSRTCYAIPGAIDDNYYVSANEYLKNGATLVTSPVDIINDYGMKYSLNMPEKEEKKVYNFTDVQRKIVDAIKEKALSCDKICQETGIDAGGILTEILQLELMDVVVRLDDDKIKLIIKE